MFRLRFSWLKEKGRRLATEMDLATKAWAGVAIVVVAAITICIWLLVK